MSNSNYNDEGQSHIPLDLLPPIGEYPSLEAVIEFQPQDNTNRNSEQAWQFLLITSDSKPNPLDFYLQKLRESTMINLLKMQNSIGTDDTDIDAKYFLYLEIANRMLSEFQKLYEHLSEQNVPLQMRSLAENIRVVRNYQNVDGGFVSYNQQQDVIVECLVYLITQEFSFDTHFTLLGRLVMRLSDRIVSLLPEYWLTTRPDSQDMEMGVMHEILNQDGIPNERRVEENANLIADLRQQVDDMNASIKTKNSQIEEMFYALNRSNDNIEVRNHQIAQHQSIIQKGLGVLKTNNEKNKNFEEEIQFLNDEKLTYESEINNLTKTNKNLYETIATYQNDMSHFSETNEEFQNQIDEYENQIRENQVEIEALNHDIRELDTNRLYSISNMKKVENESQNLRRTIQENESQIVVLQNDIYGYLADIEAGKKEIEALQNKERELQSRNESLSKKSETYEKDINEYRETASIFKSDLDKCRGELEDVKNKIDKTVKDWEYCILKGNEKDHFINDLKEKIEKLEIELYNCQRHEEQLYQEHQKLIKSIIEMKNKEAQTYRDTQTYTPTREERAIRRKQEFKYQPVAKDTTNLTPLVSKKTNKRVQTPGSLGSLASPISITLSQEPRDLTTSFNNELVATPQTPPSGYEVGSSSLQTPHRSQNKLFHDQDLAEQVKQIVTTCFQNNK